MSQETRRFLRLPEVIHRTGYRRTAIYEKVKSGEFPKQYALGPRASARAVGWLAEDVDAWIEARVRTNGGAK